MTMENTTQEMSTPKSSPVGLKGKSLNQLLSDVSIKGRFDEMLGKRSNAFISSIISAVKGNPGLEKCDPLSIISAAAIAASLDLPINGNLGSCAMVPYKDKAQFQIMRTGWVQLAQRTGLYSLINATEVYEGQLLSRNDITGEFLFDTLSKKSEKVIGYVAYFKLKNGFEKYVYMSAEECLAHGKKYSKSFNNESGLWKTNPGAMSLKTVLKRAISKWGPVSIDSPLSKAIEFDQAAVSQDGKAEFVDSTAENIKEEEVPMPTAKNTAKKAPESAPGAPIEHKAEPKGQTDKIVTLRGTLREIEKDGDIWSIYSGAWGAVTHDEAIAKAAAEILDKGFDCVIEAVDGSEGYLIKSLKKD